MLTNSQRLNPKMLSYIVLQMFIQQLHLNRAPTRPLTLIRVILEDMIHLLERTAFSLRNEEVSPDASENTENGEEYVGTVAGVFDQGWSDEADDEVVEPVRAGR